MKVSVPIHVYKHKLFLNWLLPVFSVDVHGASGITLKKNGITVQISLNLFCVWSLLMFIVLAVCSMVCVCARACVPLCICRGTNVWTHLHEPGWTVDKCPVSICRISFPPAPNGVEDLKQEVFDFWSFTDHCKISQVLDFFFPLLLWRDHHLSGGPFGCWWPRVLWGGRANNTVLPITFYSDTVPKLVS